MSRLPTLLICLLLALFAAACGGDDSSEQEASAPTPAATEEPTGAVDASAISKDLGSKPKIVAPEGSPPPELQNTDIVTGKRKPAKAGDTVAVQYVGTSWSTGEQFDSSWDRGKEPFEFELGAGMVIPGWDEGVAGMRKGGRRLLVIPPNLAYGNQSPSPQIAAGETLIFVVDLVRIG